MQMRRLVLALLVALAPLCLHSQSAASSASQNPSKFVDLVITDEGGGLHGAILFYLHKRPDTNASYTSTPGLPEPLLNLQVADQTLRFRVSHRRAHPPGSLHDVPKNFHLKLTGPDQAQLANDSERSPGLNMKRADY